SVKAAAGSIITDKRQKMRTILNGNDLIAIGYTEGRVLGLALDTIRDHFAGEEATTVLELLLKIKSQPEAFLDDEKLEALATAIIEDADTAGDGTIALVKETRPYAIYGAEHIEDGARKQMQVAMQLPVTAAGALMPDAHQGYGLPIGGVLATRNAV